MGYVIRPPESLTPLATLALMEGREPTSTEWKTWVLDSEAVYFDDTHGAIVVPECFMTDFASIPFLFRWWQTGSVGPQRFAAYFHDYLYSSQSEIGRRESDRIFRDVMGDVDLPGVRTKFRRWAMYLALRVGGWLAWRSNQKKLAEKGPNWRKLC